MGVSGLVLIVGSYFYFVLVLIHELSFPLRGMVTTAKQCQLAKLMRYTLFWRGFY